MNRLKKVFEIVRQSRSLKYVLVIAVAVLVVGFLGENSIWSHHRNKQKISELEEEIRYYRSQYERDIRQLRRLESDPHAVEEIARERYFMKHADEDIFVLSDDMTEKKTETDETTE